MVGNISESGTLNRYLSFTKAGLGDVAVRQRYSDTASMITGTGSVIATSPALCPLCNETIIPEDAFDLGEYG